MKLRPRRWDGLLVLLDGFRNDPEGRGRIAAEELAEPCRLRVHFLLLEGEPYVGASIGRDRSNLVLLAYESANRIGIAAVFGLRERRAAFCRGESRGKPHFSRSGVERGAMLLSRRRRSDFGPRGRHAVRRVPVGPGSRRGHIVEQLEALADAWPRDHPLGLLGRNRRLDGPVLERTPRRIGGQDHVCGLRFEGGHGCGLRHFRRRLNWRARNHRLGGRRLRRRGIRRCSDRGDHRLCARRGCWNFCGHKRGSRPRWRGGGLRPGRSRNRSCGGRRGGSGGGSDGRTRGSDDGRPQLSGLRLDGGRGGR